jgi:hypothetical protein
MWEFTVLDRQTPNRAQNSPEHPSSPVLLFQQQTLVFNTPDPLRIPLRIATFIQVVAETTTAKQNKRAGLQDKAKTGRVEK